MICLAIKFILSSFLIKKVLQKVKKKNWTIWFQFVKDWQILSVRDVLSIYMCGSSSPFDLVFMFFWNLCRFLSRYGLANCKSFYASFWSLIGLYAYKNRETHIFISWVSFAWFTILFSFIPVSHCLCTMLCGNERFQNYLHIQLCRNLPIINIFCAFAIFLETVASTWNIPLLLDRSAWLWFIVPDNWFVWFSWTQQFVTIKKAIFQLDVAQ